MPELHEHPSESFMGCPIKKMSFGELTRYLQGGYDTAVQETLANHVKNCTSCSENIARVEALRESGRSFMQNRLREMSMQNLEKEQSHLDEAQLAAFVDNGLFAAERQMVTEHLSECHECYQHLTALEKDLKSEDTVSLQTPLEILASLTEKVDTPFSGIKSRVKNIANRIQHFTRNLWELRWPAPAFAFATGILIMVLIYNPLQMKKTNFIVMLPLIQTESSLSEGHILSGLPTDSLNTSNILTGVSWFEFPYQKMSEIKFNWPAVQGCVKYRVGFFNDSNESMWQEVETSQNHLSVSNTRFAPNESYTIRVFGIYQQGGIGLVVNMRFQVSKI